MLLGTKWHFSVLLLGPLDVHHPATPERKDMGHCLYVPCLSTISSQSSRHWPVFSWGYRLVLVIPTPCCPLLSTVFSGGDGDLAAASAPALRHMGHVFESPRAVIVHKGSSTLPLLAKDRIARLQGF